MEKSIRLDETTIKSKNLDFRSRFFVSRPINKLVKLIGVY
jgi:hypothetical protein